MTLLLILALLWLPLSIGACFAVACLFPQEGSDDA